VVIWRKMLFGTGDNTAGQMPATPEDGPESGESELIYEQTG
jgi:hypothetical protein